MSEDDRDTGLQGVIEKKDAEIIELRNKLLRIESLLSEKVYCEYMQQQVSKKIFEIINEN